MSKMLSRFVLAIVCLCVVTSALVTSQTIANPEAELEIAQKRIKELEADIVRLRLEIAELKSRTRDDVKAPEAVIGAATRPAAIPAIPARIAGGPTAARDMPPSMEKRKTYTKSTQILEELPGDLRPNSRTGWDKYVFPKAKEWLEREALGEKYEFRTVVTDVKIYPKHKFHVTQKPGDWNVVIHFDGREQIKLFGQTFEVQVHGEPNKSAVCFGGDESLARKGEKLKVGQSARVTGKIKSVRISPSIGKPTYDLKIELTESDLDTPLWNK